MERRLSISAASCDHDSIFDLAYLRVTENVRDAVNAGVFDDRVWLGQVDAVFAKLYFDSMDAWHSGDPAARPRRRHGRSHSGPPTTAPCPGSAISCSR